MQTKQDIPKELADAVRARARKYQFSYRGQAQSASLVQEEANLLGIDATTDEIDEAVNLLNGW